MAIAATVVIEMRAGSADTNAGGFVPGSSGTDWSQQANPQYSVTDAVTNTTSTVTSATAAFGTDVVGNLASLNEGGTTRWFQIITRTNATTIVLDRATNGTGTGQTLKIGGAIGMTSGGFRFKSFLAGGAKIWLNGSFSVTGSAPLWNQAGTVLNPIIFEGYAVTRGDGGRATITRTANSIDCLDISVDFIIVKNLKLDQGVNFNTCLGISGSKCWVENCWFIASDTDGNGSIRVDLTGNNNTLHRCLIDCNSKGGQGVSVSGTGNVIQHCTQTGSHEETGIVVSAGPTTIQYSIIRNNALDGILHSGANGLVLRHNDVWKNARDGVRLTSSGNGLGNVSMQGNIFGRNTSYDVRYTPADISANTGTADWAKVEVKDNAFWSTGTGKSLNLPAFGNDLTLTANPFTDDTTTFNFSLNSVAGGGALVDANRRTVLFGDGINTGYYQLGALGAGAAVTTAAVSTAAGLPDPPDYDDIQIPTDISRGAVGGAMKPTRFLQMPSGREQRIKLWSSSRKRWSIQYEARTPDMADDLIAFWEGRDGGSRGFRMRDWAEYTVTDGPLFPNGSPYVQLVKTYVSGTQTRTHNIFAPESPTVVVKKNGSTFGGWTANYSTGVITLPVVNSKSITSISQAVSAVVGVGASHGFSSGMIAYFSGVTGMTEINGLVGEITATGASTITVDLDTSQFSAWTSGGTAATYLTTSDVLTWSGSHDYPVRFDALSQQIQQDDVFVRSWLSIEILELVG